MVHLWFIRRSKRNQFIQSHGCKPTLANYPLSDPVLGNDMVRKVIKAARSKSLLGFWKGLLEEYGYTYTTNSLLRGRTIHSAEPEIAKAVYSTNFADYSAAPARVSFKKLQGDSIFTLDGPAWSHSRSLMRPIFAKDHVADLGLLENHFQALLSLLPEDGETVDLQPLFLRFTLDSATEFVFGQSLNTLRPDNSAWQGQLHEDFDIVLQDALNRIRMSILYPFFKDKRAPAAIRNVHARAENYAREALERCTTAKNSDRGEEANTSKRSYSLLDELAQHTGDIRIMRNEAVTLLVAGRDTTASLLSHLWYLLTRTPAVWKNLLAEVDQLEGALPTYDWLKNAKYLRHCEHEGTCLESSFHMCRSHQDTRQSR